MAAKNSEKTMSETMLLQEMRIATDIHALMFKRLIDNETDVTLTLSEVLEDIANRYLQLSEDARLLSIRNKQRVATNTWH